MTGSALGAAIRDAIKAAFGLVEPPPKPQRTLVFVLQPPVPKDSK